MPCHEHITVHKYLITCLSRIIWLSVNVPDSVTNLLCKYQHKECFISFLTWRKSVWKNPECMLYNILWQV
jgi:hypothetical protein